MNEQENRWSVELRTEVCILEGSFRTQVNKLDCISLQGLLAPWKETGGVSNIQLLVLHVAFTIWIKV